MCDGKRWTVEHIRANSRVDNDTALAQRRAKSRQHRCDRIAVRCIDRVWLAHGKRSVQSERGGTVGRGKLPVRVVALDNLETSGDPLCYCELVERFGDHR